MLEAEKEENRLSREHAIAMKSLELNLARDAQQAEVRVKELQAKWASWIQIPVLIIKLPLLILLGLAYICSMFTKKEQPKRFWDLIS